MNQRDPKLCWQDGTRRLVLSAPNGYIGSSGCNELRLAKANTEAGSKLPASALKRTSHTAHTAILTESPKKCLELDAKTGPGVHPSPGRPGPTAIPGVGATFPLRRRVPTTATAAV